MQFFLQSFLSTAKRVDNVLGSVCPSVRPSVRRSPLSAVPSAAKSKEESLSVRGVCLCVELSRGCRRSAFIKDEHFVVHNTF